MQHFLLEFGTNEGRNKQVRVPHARNGVSPQNVRNAMNFIISSGAFADGRRPQTIRGASLVTVERERINVR